MKIDNKIIDEKYNIILTEKQQKYEHYHQSKIDKYECLTDEKMLPSDQSRIIEQVKFTHSPLSKPFE